LQQLAFVIMGGCCAGAGGLAAQSAASYDAASQPPKQQRKAFAQTIKQADDALDATRDALRIESAAKRIALAVEPLDEVVRVV
jgi:hypothetical protein